MVLQFSLVAILVAAPAPTVAVPTFRALAAKPELVEFVSERAAQAMTRRGCSVVTPADIQAVLGFERTKQLMGCTEDSSSCSAELAGALGVRFMMLGRLSQLGATFQLDAKLVATGTGQSIAVANRGVASEEALPAAVEALADELALQLQATGNLAPPVAEVSRPFRARLWVPVGLGIGASVAGTALIAVASGTLQGFTRPGEPLLSVNEARVQFGQLEAQKNVGLALLTAGLVAIVVGVVWSLLTDQPRATAGGATP